MNTMRICKGSQELTKFFYGGQEVIKIYYGTTAVWEGVVEDTNVDGISIYKPMKIGRFRENISSSAKVPTAINISQDMNIVGTTSPILVADFAENININPQNPTVIAFNELYNTVNINQKMQIAEMDETVDVGCVLEQYVIEPDKASEYEYEVDYVATDDTFELITDYTYTSIEQDIDSGRMCGVMVRTDDKASTEGLVIN